MAGALHLRAASRDDRIALAVLLSPFLIIALWLGVERSARQLVARGPEPATTVSVEGASPAAPPDTSAAQRLADLHALQRQLDEKRAIAPMPRELPAVALLIEPPPPKLPNLALLIEPPPPKLPNLALLIEPPPPKLPNLALLIEPPPTKLPNLALLIEPPPPKLPNLALLIEPPPTKLPNLALLIEPPPPKLPNLALIIEPPPTKLPNLALIIEPPPPKLPNLALIIEPPTLPALALMIEPAEGPPMCLAGNVAALQTGLPAGDLIPPRDPMAFGIALAGAARAQVAGLTIYNAKYQRISYPMGDVPPLFGVCTDVIVRAYRALGIDLQALIQDTGVGRGDRNIDHRRVEVVRNFLTRHGRTLPISEFAEDYLPGDIVTYYRPQNRGSTSHIAIVTDRLAPSGRPMIVHNRGWGPELEDALFVDKITGHYRFTGLPEGTGVRSGKRHAVKK